MSADVVMPRLSDSMEEGTILRWLKSPGDEVSLGEELVEIETDKANMVYEAPAAGTLIEVLAGEGDTLPIGEVIARVGEAGEAPSGDGAAIGRDASAEMEEEDGDRESPSPVPGSAAAQSPRVHAAEAPPTHLPPPLPSRLRRICEAPGAPPAAPTQGETEGSRRRPWRAGSPGRTGSSSGRSRAPGPEGGS